MTERTAVRPIAGTPARGRAPRVVVLGVALGALALLIMLSLAVGTRPIPIGVTVDSIIDFDQSNDLHLLVLNVRIPRTVLAILVGAALGLAGAMMQAMTRNALAEPGLLGVNAGAAVAVAMGIVLFGATHISEYIWFAFAGAGLAGVAVSALGRAHEAGTNPVRLVLAGAGISVVLGALTTILLINGPEQSYDRYRQWITGTLAGRGFDVLPFVAGACVLGLLLSLLLVRSFNVSSLGTELSVALGVSLRQTWIIASLAVLLLSGAATAAAGPIIFVGLAAPHVARLLVGPDHRHLMPYSMLIAALLLLAADVLGRVIIAPGEIGAGIMAAIIGGPFFVSLVRRRKLVHL